MARTGSRLAAARRAGASTVPLDITVVEGVKERVARALESTAHEAGSLSSACSLLKEAWSLDPEACFSNFSELLKRCLVVYTKDAAVERVIELIGIFAASVAGTSSTRDSAEKENIPADENIAEKMALFFSRLLSAKDKAVRYRSCEAIASLVNAAGDACLKNSNLASKLSQALLERTRDRVPLVRARALLALHALRIREACAFDDQIDTVFERLITCDPSVVVRKTALAHAVIVPPMKLLDAVLSRTRDVDERIRIMVYQQTLSRSFDPRMLSIAQRVELVQNGVSDRSANVRRACLQTMLREAWLDGICEKRLTNLMQLLDVEVNEDTVLPAIGQMLVECSDVECLRMLTSFMSELRQAKDCADEEPGQCTEPIDLNELTAERAAAAFVCAQVIAWKTQSTKSPVWSQRLATFLPCIADFCAALQYYHRHAVNADAAIPDMGSVNESMSYLGPLPNAAELSIAVEAPQTYAFVVRMLLKMARLMDLSDEAGRRVLVDTLKMLIQSPRFRAEDLELALGNLMRAQADVFETTRMVAEMITSLHADALAEEEPDGARSCSSSRCLALTEALLQVLLIHWNRLGRTFTGRSISAQQPGALAPSETSGQALMPTLLTLLSACALNHLTSDDSRERLAAVNVLGLYGLADQTGQLAMQHALLLLHVSEHDVEAVRLVALHALFDWLCAFPLESIATDDQSQASKDSWASDQQDQASLRRNLLDRLCQLLTSAETDSLQSAVVEGFAKLVFLRRLAPDAELIKRLLLLFFTPTTADNTALRQCLAVFFPSICVAGTTQHRHAFEQAFLPTLRVLVNSPQTNPLATVSPVQAGQYILFLLDPSRANNTPANSATKDGCYTEQGPTGDENVHLRLAIEMLNEIILEPRAEMALVCARLLLHISIATSLLDSDTIPVAESVQRLVQSALEETSSATLKRQLERFGTHLQDALDAAVTAGTTASTIDVDPNSSETSIRAATIDHSDTPALP
jgi:condensin complex subunit 3